ncbi:MAG: DNA repair protein RadC [Prevotellaceae bacterium]|jgi:DNA repair protein RadC|nr:DNA repair protein RadC [Prevotellaceae bacterium]
MENTAPLTIKNWAEEDRPREKMLAKGALALSDAELLAILIGSGTRNETAVDLAMRLLASVNNNLNGLWKLGIKDFMKIKGIGKARAISIAAAMELGRRRKDSELQKRFSFTSSNEVTAMFIPILGDLPHEEFWVLLTNRSGKLIERIKISQGGVIGVSVDIRMVVKSAIEQLASGVIAVHNHPSGNCRPSNDDIKLTEKLKSALALFNISLLDHIIVTDNKWFSFADEGIL